MTVYVVSNVARTNELSDYVGVQGTFSTEDKAHKFMRDLWAIQNETSLDYERTDEWTEEFITDKAVYTISETVVDGLFLDDE